MNPDTPPPSIHEALKLLRRERPPEELMDRFVDDFHRRQRRDVATVSLWQLTKDRLAAYLHDFTMPRWVMAAGVAYLAVMCTLYLRPLPKPTTQSELAAARERQALQLAAQSIPRLGQIAAGSRLPTDGPPPSTHGVNIPVTIQTTSSPIMPGPRRTLGDPVPPGVSPSSPGATPVSLHSTLVTEEVLTPPSGKPQPGRAIISPEPVPPVGNSFRPADRQPTRSVILYVK